MELQTNRPRDARHSHLASEWAYFGGEMRGFAEHSSVVHDSVTFRPYDSAERPLTGS